MCTDDSRPRAASRPRHEAGTARVRPDSERSTVYTDDAGVAAAVYDEFFTAIVGRCERLHDGCLALVGFVGDSTTAVGAVVGELQDRADSALLVDVLRAEVTQLQRVAAVLADYAKASGELVSLFRSIATPDFVQVTP